MAVVQSAGVIESLGSPWAPSWSTSRSLVLYGPQATADYAALYRTQTNVRTVVDFLARNIAQLALKTYRRVSAEERREIGDHPLARTLRRPSPWRSRYWFVHTLVCDLCVYDQFFAIKVRGPNDQLVLVRVPPEAVTVEGSSWLQPESFKIDGGRRSVDVPAERVWYLHGHNPDDARVGLSPLETLRRILAEEAAAGEYREHYWKNAARIEGIIERPLEAPDWSDVARRRFREEWQSRYAGPEGAGLTPVLEEGMVFKASSFSAQDSQYLEARKLTREEVASAYHVPPPMVGILDHATFSNIEEQHRMLYQDTLGPWLTMIEEDVELQLLPEFADVDDVYVEFNLQEKLKGSFEEQARAFQTAVGAPWLSRNEARARQNLPPIDGADQLVIPLNVIEGGQASPTDSAPALGAAASPIRAVKAQPARYRRHYEQHRKMFERFFTRQREALLNGLARKGRKAVVGDLFDSERWNRELEEDVFALAWAAATDVGAEIADRFGVADWTGEPMIPFLRENARIFSEDVNRNTIEDIEGADPDLAAAIAKVFAASLLANRVAGLSQSRTTLVGNFGQTEAATAAGVRYKRWVVTSANPRPSHAAVNGETVELSARFSNGAKWPGDPSLQLEQRAGCTCLLEFVGDNRSGASAVDAPSDPMEMVAKALELNGRALQTLAAMASQPVPPAPAPVVNVAPPEVRFEAGAIVSNVEAPRVDVHPAPVNVAAPVVNVEAPKARRREIVRDDEGNITEIRERDDG